MENLNGKRIERIISALHDHRVRTSDTRLSLLTLSRTPIAFNKQMNLLRLRNRSDRRVLLWTLVFFPLVPLVGLLSPSLSWWLLPLSLYLGAMAGVLSHYHVHRGAFHSATANDLYSAWLSAFYGFPLFSWIPTHNQNHHKYNDGPGDRTSTRRSGQPDSFFQALLYPSRSSAWQLPAVWNYFFHAGKRRKRAFVLQLLAVVLWPLAYAMLAFSLHGLDGGNPLFALVILPAAFAPWSMMFTNYIQHVGCDSSSPNNHSRNFVGRWENWLVFDAGLHTVHHDNPGTHWSEYRSLHEQRREDIDPSLLQRNIFSFLFNRYVLRHPLYAEASTSTASQPQPQFPPSSFSR